MPTRSTPAKTTTKAHRAGKTPAARLTEIQRELTRLRQEQFELIGQMDLASSEERIVVNALTVCASLDDWLDTTQIPTPPTPAQRRRSVTFSRKLRDAKTRVDRLAQSEAKAAATQAIDAAVQRLLTTIFRQ